MARPSQIRQIVAELRRALGPEASANEILRLAGVIVESHRQPERFDFEDPILRSPFFALDVDTALEQDNGWKVVAFERQQGMAFGDEISDNYHLIRAKIRRFVGPTLWPRSGMD
jgi:hypothetical protein